MIQGYRPCDVMIIKGLYKFILEAPMDGTAVGKVAEIVRRI